MAGFTHSRKGIALKSGQLVNKSNHYSDRMRGWLEACAVRTIGGDSSGYFDKDELVNEAWLKHSRYKDYVQPQGTRMVMLSYIAKNRPVSESRQDRSKDMFWIESYDDAENLLWSVSSKIPSAETRFMLDLYVRHGMNARQIGDYFNLTSQAIEHRIRKAVRDVVFTKAQRPDKVRNDV